MGRIADNLAALNVTATSPDGNIKAKVQHPGVITLGFRPDTYPRYTETGLEHQLARLCTLGMTGYTRAFRIAIEAPDKRDERWDARDRRYREELDTMVNDGMSAGRRVKVRATGMMSWQVKIKPGTVEELDEPLFVAECDSAMESLLADHRRQVIALKHEHFDLNLPTFLKQPPPPPPGAKKR